MSTVNPDNAPTSGARLELVGLYLSNSEIRLEGDRRSMLELVRILNGSFRLWNGNLTVPEQMSPLPYDGFVTAFRVESNDDPVWVGLENDTLVITGAVDKLRILADNIEWFANSGNSEASSGAHLHM